MNVIRSHKHQIYTETVNKIALSSDDDKTSYPRRWYSHSSDWLQAVARYLHERLVVLL